MTPEITETNEADILQLIEKQRSAHLSEGIPSAERRTAWLNRSIMLLADHQDKIVAALNEDFGNRTLQVSMVFDVIGSLNALKYARKHVRKWMRREKRATIFPFNLFGGRSYIEYQPLGCVGCVSPWNFPFNLAFSPMASIFAAGNRVILKPSEFTPHSSMLMKELLAKYYSEEEVAVVTGGAKTGEIFCRMPFDHLIFTGGTSVARHVAAATAKNLVPTTLELGGKSPVIVSSSADLEQAAARIMTGKTFNAGQICLAPDYVMVHKNQLDEFVDHARRITAQMFPALRDNPDYTSMINQQHYDRIRAGIKDAQEKGFTVVEINPAEEDFATQAHHKIPPTLILEPDDNTTVMQEEIFGPVLPVKTYDTIQDAVTFVNTLPHPLALYYFGQDTKEEKFVVNNTSSGGVTINDVMTHVIQDDLPFGGVGCSGTGAYHGVEGFKNFSHAKSVYRQSPLEMLAGLLRPPYANNKMVATFIAKMSKK